MMDLKYLFRKKHYIGSAAFIVAFSAAFLAIYTPFSSTLWISFSRGHVLMTLMFYVTCLMILAVSRILLAQVNKRRGISARYMVFNTLVEFALIAIVYVLFSFQFTDITLYLILKVMFCVAMILMIPYTIYLLYASFKAKNEENNLLRFKLEALEKELEEKGSNAVDNDSSEEQKLLNFSDSNGSLKLTIDEEAICYVESQDNYVKICYDLNGSIASYMLRCSSMKFEEFCVGTKIMRCHRSYFVNTRRIRSIRYENRRSFALLDMPNSKEIPISKTYIKVFSELGIS
ncbi:MAG: LytTR family transcriptional regulator [Bacteroidales bacterium]|nr:LytTR family transcriptional regulator [Bacteroidales bacterium]